jgi:hypothetical protein
MAFIQEANIIHASHNSNVLSSLVMKGSDDGVLHLGLLNFWTFSVIYHSERTQCFGPVVEINCF